MPAGPQNQQTAAQPTLEQSYRLVRMVHAFLLVSVVLYLGVTISMARSPKHLPPAFPIAIGAVAASVTIAAFVIRSRTLGPSEEILRTNPTDATALAKWRVGHIISLALAESIVLNGFVLKFLGAPWSIAGIFFAAGAALMLIFTPQRP